MDWSLTIFRSSPLLSLAIFSLGSFFFVDQEATQKSAPKPEKAPTAEKQIREAQPYTKEPGIVETGKSVAADTQTSMPARIPQSITVDTPLYRVKLSEKGAGFSSIVLKNYRETVQDDSPLKELLPQENPIETALIGFAGQRVIEQTIREKLPDGFQRSEYLLDHGMVDMVVHRHELRESLAGVLSLLMDKKGENLPELPLLADQAAS